MKRKEGRKKRKEEGHINQQKEKKESEGNREIKKNQGQQRQIEKKEKISEKSDSFGKKKVPHYLRGVILLKCDKSYNKTAYRLTSLLSLTFLQPGGLLQMDVKVRCTPT